MKIFFLFPALLFVLVSCTNPKVETPQEGEAPTETLPQGNFVSLTALQMQTADIRLGEMEIKNLQTSVRANGMLTVPNHNKALVTSVNDGVIKTLLIQPGDFVRKGQAIATLANPDIARLQQELQTTEAQLNLTQLELARQKELVAGNAAPLKNVQRVETELATLKVTRNSLRKQLSAMGVSLSGVSRGNIVTTLTITAPISGTISEVSAQIGSHIDPSTPIAQIVNNSQLHLDLFVYEKDLSKISVNQVIHFTLTNNPGKEYDARIYSIGTAFASETKTIPIHAVVNGDKTGLIEGMNISAVISLGEGLVPAVPNEAIVSFQGQDYIFVARETANDSTWTRKVAGGGTDMQFQRVPVVKGTSGVGYTEVKLLEELPPNSKLITKGAFFALAKMTNLGEEE
jgi:RND family efflux transporter MFP subunit